MTFEKGQFVIYKGRFGDRLMKVIWSCEKITRALPCFNNDPRLILWHDTTKRQTIKFRKLTIKEHREIMSKLV